MKEKIRKIYERPWFLGIEYLVAALYAVWSIMKILNVEFKGGYEELNLLVPILATFFLWIVISAYIRYSDSKLYKSAAIIYTIVITIDACANDSIMGMVFLVMLLMHLIGVKQEKIVATVELFLISVIVCEIMSVLLLMEVIRVDSIMLQQIGGIWIDVILVFTIVFLNAEKAEKLSIKKGANSIISWVTMASEILCIVVLCSSLYARMNSYYVTADQVEDGTSVYIINANKKDEALTCQENKLLMGKATNNENQEFTFRTSEQQGYWNIETNNENVFDVSKVKFQEGNDVIAWEKNGVSGQDWTLRDVGSEQVEFISFDPGYRLTWGKHQASKKSATNSAYITANQEDNHRQFLMKNAQTLKIPGVGWVINGNRFIIIAEYLIIMVLLSVVTSINIIKRYKEKKSEATEEDI